MQIHSVMYQIKKKKNANSIFTNEKLDKSGELVDTVNNFSINDAKYY